MPALPAVTRDRLPATLLVLLAVGLVANAGWFVYADFRPTYQLSVTATGEPPGDVEVLDYDALTPAARDAFDAARDGPYVVHEDPAFRETFPLFQEVYVRADGTVHELWLRADGVNGLSLLLAVPLGVVGLVLAALGVRSYRRRDVRLPLSLLAGLGASWLVAVVATLPGPVVLGRVPVLPVVGVFVGVSAATWLRLGRSDWT